MERANTISTLRWPAWLNAAALLIASFTAITALSLQVRPGAEVVAVAFPPWWNSQRAFLAAASADAAIRHDGLARLRAAGVWLMVDPQAITACFLQ